MIVHIYILHVSLQTSIFPEYYTSFGYRVSVVSDLKGLDIVVRLPPFIHKGDNFCELLVAFRITKTRLYNFDPLKPQFYIIKLGFTGV